jgi:hypothetical protein
MPGRLLFLLLIGLVGFDQPKLVKTKVAEGITVSIPVGWRPMDEMDFRERYRSVRAPIAAYTNDERTIDFSVNISATQWPDANVEVARSFFKASLKNMFDRVEFIDEGVLEIKGKKYVYFEFESRVNGNPAKQEQRDPILKYTYQQYLVEKNRTLVFSFNCSRRDREEWQPVAKTMMKSVRVK